MVRSDLILLAHDFNFEDMPKDCIAKQTPYQFCFSCFHRAYYVTLGISLKQMLSLLGSREQIFIQMPGKIQSLTDPVECVISSRCCGPLTEVINGKPNSVLYAVNLGAFG